MALQATGFSSTAPSQQPATYAERGATVPFTTPGLIGNRVRLSDRRSLELVIPNQSGKRGVYVVPWGAVSDLCQPTLHDVELHAALARETTVTPANIQRIARIVASGGAAGRAARAAAIAAQEAESARLEAITRYLQPALQAQGGTLPSPAELRRLAVIINAIGVGPGATNATIQQQISQVVTLRDGIADWRSVQPDQAALATLIHALAALTVHCATWTLDQAAVAMQAAWDGGGLVQAWRARLGELTELANRPAWVMDGWWLPCLIWQQATADRSAALIEVGQLVPLPPQQAEEWGGHPLDSAVPETLRRMVGLHWDGRIGPHLLDLVARNELLRALGA